MFGSAPRPDADFYDLAERERRVPAAEMAVAEAALADGGAIAVRLLRQLREAGHVWRRIDDDGGYELRISTTDDLTVRDVPRNGWTSDPIPVTTVGDVRSVELTIFAFEAGVVGLLGNTLDGRPWPRTWQVEPTELVEVRAKAPWLDLPTPAALRAARETSAAAIATWLGDDAALRGRRGVIRVEPPATVDAIESLATTQHFELPEAYIDLLRHADGIEVGKWIVLGTRDAYRLDMPGPSRLVIAPPDETGALTIAETGEVIHVDPGDGTSDGRVVALDLRRWLRRKLRRPPSTASSGR